MTEIVTTGIVSDISYDNKIKQGFPRSHSALKFVNFVKELYAHFEPNYIIPKLKGFDQFLSFTQHIVPFESCV